MLVTPLTPRNDGVHLLPTPANNTYISIFHSPSYSRYQSAILNLVLPSHSFVNSMTLLNDVYTQLLRKPPFPDADFSGKTIIVTGANVGLGKEAVKHFVRLNAEKVIATVRSTAKGEAAKAEIEAETKRTGVVDIWALDYSNYASVKTFTDNVAKLPRVDAVVLNAGVATEKFEIFEDNESTITVNVVSTTLLVLLLLPTLRSFAANCDIVPVITIVSSGIHAYTNFPERKATNSLATLNNKEKAVMTAR